MCGNTILTYDYHIVNKNHTLVCVALLSTKH